MHRLRSFGVLASLSVALLLIAAPRAHAQTLTYEGGYFAPGVNASTGAPIQVAPLTVTCNQTFSLTAGKPTNPTKAEWDDPAASGRACRATIDPATTLASQPVGLDYQFGLRAKDGIGTASPWALVPFDLRRPVAAPTGLRIGS